METRKISRRHALSSALTIIMSIPAIILANSVRNAKADSETLAKAGLGLLTAFVVNDEQISGMAKKSVQEMDDRENVAQQGSVYAGRSAMLADMFRTVNGKRLNFKVYMNPDINAFAAPDGSIRIYSGLMDHMSDKELIWVAGHEIGHVVRGHSLQQFKLAYSVRSARELAAMAGPGKMLSSELGGLFEQAINAQFSQQHEYEADDTGLLLLRSAGHNPMASVAALEKIAAFSGSNPNIVAQFISTHPAPQERARRLRGKIAGRHGRRG